MSTAYIILAHRAPQQVARLIQRICGDEDHVFLHVDRRTPLEPFQRAVADLDARDRVRFARRRFRSRWGAVALLDATLTTAEQAVQECLFTHACLISGDSYPLVPPSTMRAFLDHAGERSFMFSSDGSALVRPDRDGNRSWFWDGDLRRVTYRHYQVGDRQLHVPNRLAPWLPRLAPPPGMLLQQGSQWWILSRRSIRLVIETFVRQPELRRYFKRVQAPDEWAFQMVLGNSELRSTVVNDDMQFVNWKQWHAQTLTIADLAALRAAPKLFARKLDPSNLELADALDRLIHTRTTDDAAVLDALVEHCLAGR